MVVPGSLVVVVLASSSAAVAQESGRTLLGKPLREPAWPAETRARLEKDLEIARAVMEVAPEREDSWIWLGRRLGYLTRWDEAIEVFTDGLERFPDSYKLLRFRGRHLARNRQFEAALADYRRAADLVEDAVDSYEPDGIINAQHRYLGSYRANIHYYLGQTAWAVGDWQLVVRGMTRANAEPLVQHDDRLVSTTFWRYLALRKLGRHAEAEQLVAAISADLDVLENGGYEDAVRFFQGAVDRDDLSATDPLAKFAIAMDHHFRGEQQRAEAMWRALSVDLAQGYWPAETELLAATRGGRDVTATIKAWVRMWNNDDSSDVDRLFLTDDSVTYFSSEKHGRIRGIDALREHHAGFGFVAGGKASENRLWLEQILVHDHGTSATATAIWFFEKPDAEVQEGPVTMVLVKRGRDWRFAHMHFANKPQS